MPVFMTSIDFMVMGEWSYNGNLYVVLWMGVIWAFALLVVTNCNNSPSGTWSPPSPPSLSHIHTHSQTWVHSILLSSTLLSNANLFGVISHNLIQFSCMCNTCLIKLLTQFWHLWRMKFEKKKKIHLSKSFIFSRVECTSQLWLCRNCTVDMANFVELPFKNQYVRFWEM